MTHILNVTYISVWDGGYEIETSAKYDTKSHLVFDIKTANGIDSDGDEVQILDEEYILLPNAEKLLVGEYNGEYRTTPPTLKFTGSVEDMERFMNELEAKFSLEENFNIKVKEGQYDIEIYTLTKDYYENIDALSSKFALKDMQPSLEYTANEMVSSLKEYANRKEISLNAIRELFSSHSTDGLNALDELFKDNGEGRVDYFSSFSHDYAREYTMDHLSVLYDEKRWEVELKAMKQF